MGHHRIDRELLHRYLRDKADSHGRLRILQTEVADQIGCSKFTLNRLLKELEEAGRVTRISRRRATAGLYVIADPKQFDNA